MRLLLLAVVAVTANPGVAIVWDTTSGHHPPLLDCTPAPAPSTRNDSSFRANLASALADLPSVAEAAPERFATLQSVEAGPDRAFARGFCLGAPGSSSSGDCLACLTAAATDVTRGCGNASRRAGVWRAGCFLAYADTSASSAHEDAFRSWFYAGPETAGTLASGVCIGYRVPADCTRCLYDSLRAAPALGWLSRLRGDEVIVAGYSCCLRIQKPQYEQEWNKGSVFFGIWVLCMLLFEALVIVALFINIIKTLQLQELPQLIQ